ncbi:uncharacterized protein TA06250 [Theileria annulata]|uniref:Uncharacterized protein n=1 Tax=Theileria annulata TaxID=5874 RepID=Q4UHP6_THEAN|nr:uncharacterized protein TA06250 [Theileria annulata]CAI73393.1 hypothetical protein TA06250 [Theileria annulata]|eukprot:XP_954070.1 hypothetical protein TA06250 [Theileria annulata]
MVENELVTGKPKQNVLTCTEKDYLNSLISLDLNDSLSFSKAINPSEHETELYVEALLKRLNSLDEDIWYSVETIQNNVCNTLTRLCNLFYDKSENSNHDAELFETVYTRLKRIEDLSLAIKCKYDKTQSLRELKRLKNVIIANQKVLSLIYNWDNYIKSIQSMFLQYTNRRNEHVECSSVTDGVSQSEMYFILNSEGFTISDLDRLKAIISQLKLDYDTCLDNLVNTNVAQTLSFIMDKYYIILQDFTSDIVNYVITTCKIDRNDSFKPTSIDISDDVREKLVKYVEYYSVDGGLNYTCLNRHLKNKLEEIFMNHFKTLGETSLNLFSNTLTLNLALMNKVQSVLNSFFEYFFNFFITFKPSYHFIMSHQQNENVMEMYNKLIVNILLKCILNSNVYNSILRSEEVFECVESILNIYNEIFNKFQNYIDQLNLNQHIESANLIPFDILDNYTFHIYNQQVSNTEQMKYNSLEDCISNFRLLLPSQVRNVDQRPQILLWLSIYCKLNNLKVEYDNYVESCCKFVKEYFSALVPRFDTNPINTKFELSLRDFIVELLETHGLLVESVHQLLLTATMSFQSKIDLNVYSSLRENHDWKLAHHLSQPFRQLVFSNSKFSDSNSDNFSNKFLGLDSSSDMASTKCLDSNNLMNQFEIKTLLYTASQSVSKYISNVVTFLIKNLYEDASGKDNKVNMYVEYIGEYYINLLSKYCEHNETFKILQKSFEMFIDEEFENLTKLKNQKDNIQYLIKIAKLLNINTSDSLSMLL